MARQLIQFGRGEKENMVKAMLQFLDRPDAAGRLMTAMGGFLFEDWLEQKARQHGMSCENVSAKRLPYDIVINGYRVQAKSSGCTTGVVDVRPVRPPVGSIIRRYSASDFDVLAIHLASFDERYFIPASAFQCQQFDGMLAGSFARHQHGQWRDAWYVLCGVAGGTNMQQKLLF